VLGISVVALLPTIVLSRIERRARTAQASALPAEVAMEVAA
jgi:hypothetical protein